MWGKRAKIDTADKLFSKYIRLRDGACLYCGKRGEPDKDGLEIKGLDCSHYWSRGREATRYEPDNCMTLCRYHHNILGHGDGRDQYREMMIGRLGKDRFKSLEVQAHSYKKKDRKMEAIIWRAALKELT